MDWADIWNHAREGLRKLIWERREFHRLVPGNFLLKPVRLAILTTLLFRENFLRTHASGLSFYLLLSLVPLLAFIFLLFKVFQLPAKLKPLLLDVVTGGNMMLVEQISTYIEKTQSTTLGSVGIATLVVIGYLLLQRVKATLNVIWRVEKWPGIGARFIEYLAMMTVTPLLLVATFSASTFLASPRIIEALSGWEQFNGLVRNLAGLSGYAIVVLIVLYAYQFLPDTRVRVWASFIGALVAGIALKVAQNFYISGMILVSNYNLIYGALAFLPLLMVWFFVGWLIFLFGAQLSCVIQNYTLLTEQRRAIHRGGATAPYVALVVLIAFYRLFRKWGAPVRLRALAPETGLPPGAVEDAVARLKSAHFITALEDHPYRYVPRELSEQTNMAEVLERLKLMPNFAEPPLLLRTPELESLGKAFGNANLAMSRPLKKLVLSDLANDPAGGGKTGEDSGKRKSPGNSQTDQSPAAQS